MASDHNPLWKSAARRRERADIEGGKWRKQINKTEHQIFPESVILLENYFVIASSVIPLPTGMGNQPLAFLSHVNMLKIRIQTFHGSCPYSLFIQNVFLFCCSSQYCNVDVSLRLRGCVCYSNGATNTLRSWLPRTYQFFLN